MYKFNDMTAYENLVRYKECPSFCSENMVTAGHNVSLKRNKIYRLSG